jgi:transcriptional antiterminator
MNIEEIKARKTALEAELTNLISVKLNEFRQETGVSNAEIILDSVDVTSYACKSPQSIYHVRLKVEI